jgi:hypothetical protein
MHFYCFWVKVVVYYGRGGLVMKSKTIAGGAYVGTTTQSASEFRKDIKSYALLTEPVFKACDFERFKARSSINFLDGMSGPGKLGLDIMKRLQGLLPAVAGKTSFYFNDVRIEPLRTLPEDTFLARCDVRELGKRFPVLFHVVAVRYGVKDLPQGEQANALESIRESMAPGGRLVIADMTADRDAQQGIIEVHATKQRLAGRDEAKEGRCYIPRLGEWTALLAAAGFENVSVTHRDVSMVETEDWRGQFSADVSDGFAIPLLNGLIRDTAESNAAFGKECAVKVTAKAGAPEKPVSDLNTDQISVSLSFPIVVIAADKPVRGSSG